MNMRFLPVLFLFAGAAAAQWQAVAPAANPGPLAAAGMAFDPSTGTVLLFGGDNGSFSPSAQTWRYDGVTWSQLQPATSPTAKVGVELVHDANRGVTVMYGSLNTSFFGGASVDETWEWSGTTWTQVFPTVTPGGLGGYGACFDAVRNRVVLYGGIANNFFPIAESGTWEFDGTNWSAVTTTGTPGPLERPAMCFHAALNRTLLFGGIDPQTGGVDTTWLYDGATATWSAVPIAGARPPARSGGKLAYDDVRGVSVLTGGSDPMTGSVIVDTWEFDGSAWTHVPSTVAGRWQPMLAFMPNRRQLVLYGGLQTATFTYLATTHEYGATARTFGNGCAGSNGVPALAATDAPRLGGNFPLALTNLNPTVGAAIFVLSLTSVPPTPLDVIGMPGCTAYVTPDALVAAPASAGASNHTLAIPGALALLGVSLFGQGLSLDPNVNAAWLVTSNAVEGVLGR
jgi:hypothetical protein